MKNKHLLLIFLATLSLGLVAKFSPWFKSDVFQLDLLHVDAEAIQRIGITQAGMPELLLEHGDEGWVASQEDFAVRSADSTIAPMLEVLRQMRSLRIVHSRQRDTLLIGPLQSFHVEVLLRNGRRETFEIGREIIENKQPATFVEIDRHEGVYLTEGHLRRIFGKSVDDFRDRALLRMDAGRLREIRILSPGIDTLNWLKTDSFALWNTNATFQLIPDVQVQQWLAQLQRLNELPFASHSDEIHVAENLKARLVLSLSDQPETLEIQVFEMNGGQAAKQPYYLLQSSQNPLNFFQLNDGLLAKTLLSGPSIPAEAVSGSALKKQVMR